MKMMAEEAAAVIAAVSKAPAEERYLAVKGLVRMDPTLIMRDDVRAIIRDPEHIKILVREAAQ